MSSQIINDILISFRALAPARVTWFPIPAYDCPVGRDSCPDVPGVDTELYGVSLVVILHFDAAHLPFTVMATIGALDTLQIFERR